MERNEVLAKLCETSDFPVVIVGGGINGVGLFRELCLQGIDVLLVERSDFGTGASAASSRMIHGGLRYLENGEFRLVRESLKERDLLLKNAPHYVRPLPTTIPIFSWLSGIFAAAGNFFLRNVKPANRGALVVKIGLSLYDFYTNGRHAMPAHTFSSKSNALKAHAKLNSDIVCTATYYDAWISYPERLCLELAIDGEQINPNSHAVNYMSLCETGGDSITLMDELTGEKYRVRPQVLINAGGAWVDQVNERMNRSTHFIGGTKGSHLMIDHADLYEAVADKMIYYENSDNRICIMFRLHGKVMVGSTDIRIDSPDDVTTSPEDIAYMLESVRQVFPDIEIADDQIVFHFCGVRPLPYSDDSRTGAISRDHSFKITEPDEHNYFPVYSLIGGKWTTFRAFSEQVTESLLNTLGQTRRQTSENVAIGGGKDYPSDIEMWIKTLTARTHLDEARVTLLMDRYGTRAEEIATFIAEGEDRPLTHLPAYSLREIEYMVRHERVFHLLDVVLRRTTIALQGDLTTPLLHELAQITGSILGWSSDQIQTQIEETTTHLATYHGISLPLVQEVSES